jgi:hypothetical protein
MATNPSMRLSKEEFASLLKVGNTCAVSEPPAVIPRKHRARLISLGYMANLSGRLRMTFSGRMRLREQASPEGPLLKSIATTKA